MTCDLPYRRQDCGKGFHPERRNSGSGDVLTFGGPARRAFSRHRTGLAAGSSTLIPGGGQDQLHASPGDGAAQKLAPDQGADRAPDAPLRAWCREGMTGHREERDPACERGGSACQVVVRPSKLKLCIPATAFNYFLCNLRILDIFNDSGEFAPSARKVGIQRLRWIRRVFAVNRRRRSPPAVACRGNAATSLPLSLSADPKSETNVSYTLGAIASCDALERRIARHARFLLR